MTPDARKHNSDPVYLRKMICRAGLSQRGCARQIGISERAMRKYVSLPVPETPAPYPVQFAIESLGRRPAESDTSISLKVPDRNTTNQKGEAMNVITTRTTAPDFSGFKFYVESGREFDREVFLEAHGNDLSDEEVDAINAQAKTLKEGEWLLVEAE